MGRCIVQVDRRKFKLGEVVYIMLTNVSDRTLYIGSWQVLDSSSRVVFTMEPPQALIPPSSSIMVTWFQVNNEGTQVKSGKYEVVWRPKDEDGNEYSCSTQIEVT
ncbi:hypothetical protein [Caldivirga sp.]|uniref:hypothetical protein n=1 Tax=Caldivirga sp. TaxID=2080243 RepID=UPI0025C15F74|nr:hypothetical protein [Caldivirga sp.]